ncbi:conserved hypothetical protein [Rubrobacter xylanophilus DSM 9941]|uniref:Uncharacterized protein n=1 Tax=Rubrobacter xylanophilus (strain DSM 9941 / JCM 11954 / NBRC 16129 / PRD-1) TaxID=266117 RepID=Q1ASP1_RUBXD|nr:hypothetical protein [Rubrobacter xylanophilus]ABG05587.1 conserved hypothetical protein [Rubrobacter xylanophilus DSM 9941]
MRAAHGTAAVFGLFALGLAVLFLTLPGAGRDELGLRVPENYGDVVPSQASGGRGASPHALPPASSPWPSSEGLGCPTRDLRLLVLSADGEETTLPAIRQTLDYLGTPYSVYVAAEEPPLTRERLAEGCHGFYQGVILASGNLSYVPPGEERPRSALSEEEWEALREYESEFGVRRAAWYAYPEPEYGLREPEGSGDEPVRARLTAEGRELFGYLNPESPVEVRDAFVYRARPAPDAIPLLVDGRGHALAVLAEHPGGRQTLALTFSSNPWLTHNLLLSYGLVDWVTGGLFLGERRVYLTAHVDDVFIPDQLVGGGSYRMTGEDLRAAAARQREWRSRELFRELRLDLAFNAYGTTGLYIPDTLTPAARELEAEFRWINHTYRHLDWDEVGYRTAASELEQNDAWARGSELSRYSPVNLVTPEYSGLGNPQAMRAARAAGIRYLVGDTSEPGFDNPSPNAGLSHPLEPSIFVVPRYPTNLGFDVSTPREWTSDYNRRYRDFWGRRLSYAEVLDRESDVLLSYMLKGDINPIMFHQANLRAYDGEHTLLTDLLHATLRKYAALYRLPVLSPPMQELGERARRRTAYDRAGVMASASPGGRVRLLSRRAAEAPVTGLESPGAEVYGGEPTTYVALEPGEPAVLPLRE